MRVFFEIGLHSRDKYLLKQIQFYFSGLGSIKEKSQGKCICFSVQSVIDMKTIINHFEKFPLKTKKQADFILFKSVVELMMRKEHLTKEGFRKILAIKARARPCCL